MALAVVRGQLLTPVHTLETAASCLRSALGNGTMGGQPRKVSVAEAEARRQGGLCQAREQAMKTLKQCREE